uniref:lipoprotein N-acyltransferase Lnb domain-containing protein n=1 Tax=Halobacteriovorax sp. TaxID=2020862 RepID=UPI00356619F4
MRFLFILLFLTTQNTYSIENDSIEFLQWYTQKKELYTSSKKYINRLKRRLDNNQILGLELIIADSTDERVESKFGHALFRFVDGDSDPGNDITISFVADVNGPKASNISGVIGKYGVYPEVKSLRLFIKQYVKDQSRPLERHIIPSNEIMHRELVKTLDSWWNEIHEAREDIYKESVKKAKINAIKKGSELFGEESFELLEIKFYDEEFKSELIQSFGIVEKEATPFKNDSEKDKALYRQAYTRSYKKLDVEKGEIVLNLFQEVWKVKITSEILELDETIEKIAIEKAKDYFSSDEIKLFTRFDKSLEKNGFYAMTTQTMNSLNILRRVPIKMSVKNLEVTSAASEVLGKYTFFSNNCAGAVIKFLKKSNFPHKKTIGIQGRVPVKLNKWMSRSLLVPYPSITIDGAKKLRSKIARILGFTSREFEQYRFPIHQWQIIKKYTTDEEKFLFYDLYNSNLEAEYVELIRNDIQGLNAPDYNDIYGLLKSSPLLYELCSTKDCAKKVETVLNKVWTKKEIKKTKKLINRTGNNTFIHEGLTKSKEILMHLKLLKYIPE